MTPQAARPDHERPAPTNTHTTHAAGIAVDGARPAVAAVTSLPRSYGLNPADRLVLLALACDSFDGETTAPGYDALADWTGMLRSSVAEVLRRLAQPVDGARPALIERAATKRGRDRTTWRLLLHPSGDADLSATEDQPSGDADWFELQPSGEPSAPTGPLPFPSPGGTTPREVATERAHENDSRARSALERITRERRLPVSAAELLPHAYRLGHGDPWEGYREVKTRTEATLDGARDPRRALLSRLTAAPPEPRASRAPAGPCQHAYDTESGYCLHCAQREDVAS